MRKFKTLYIGLLAMMVTLGSCDLDTFLTEEPILSQTNELTLSTWDGLQDAGTGMYSLLYSTSWYGRYSIVVGDLKAGNAIISPKTSGRFTNEFYWNNTDAATSPLWSVAYYTISRANNILESLPNLPESEIESDEDLDNLKAEALFVRALAHFDLVRTYAQPYSFAPEGNGVPVILITENGKPARNTVSEVYAQVVEDLLEAESLMSDDYVRSGTDTKGYATKPAIQALLARVYLNMENWQDAANYATKLISNTEFSMYTADDYTTADNGGIWGAEVAPTGGECIMEVYGAEGNSAHGNWDVISYILSPEGYGDVGASTDLTDLFEDGDVRRDLFRTHADYGDAEWSLKYPGKDGNLREDNIYLFRLSEMYLTRAEALFRGATISGVTPASDINMIRTNRGLDALSSVDLATIYLERRKELCFEGHEYFDLARTQRDLVRYDYPTGSANQDVSFPDYKWAFPIPLSEMDANPNMVQNPTSNN